MPVNSRAKGVRGEREFIKTLNHMVSEVRFQMGLPDLEKDELEFNRNFSQSAVGGDDVDNRMGISFEIKRHEKIDIPTWWSQCQASALRCNGIPVLVFKQNRQRVWRVCMIGGIPQMDSEFRVEIPYERFQAWFKEHVKQFYLNLN